MDGLRSELQEAGVSRLIFGLRRIAMLAIALLLAALALGSCRPDTAMPSSTSTATLTSTPTPTATTAPMFAPGLDFSLGSDWPAIDSDSGSSVKLIYSQSPDELVEVLGSPAWDHMALITAERTALLDTSDLGPVSIIETVGLGDLAAAVMDADTLAMAFREGGLRIFDVPSGEQLQALGVSLNSLALSPDGELLAGGSEGVFIWDTRTGELLHEWMPEGMLSGLRFSPDGRMLAIELVGGPFEGVELWSLESGERLRRLDWQMADPVYFVRFSPDWDDVAWASRAIVLLMDIESGLTTATLEHEDYVGEAEFSPEGGILATTSAALVEGEFTGVVDLWESESGAKVATLVHGEAAVRVTFSPDGTILATATYDGLIRLWDVASGEMLAELGGDQEQVFRLLFVEGGRLLVSASWQGEVRFWAVEQ